MDQYLRLAILHTVYTPHNQESNVLPNKETVAGFTVLGEQPGGRTPTSEGLCLNVGTFLNIG